ncbi:hypothetical protein SAMN05216582_11763 [Selenomonas ruminantium]|uniref:AIPR protein n=1 Tax=Selenomonas ruminantium TaxID=971 RepID=A0A1M6VB29_SELRU|nr:hypothetical protein [Selenomonas ruminantium]SHK78506.1 hypothetical protein SAMN05216582_11763 [Selenomonas ruminantium]
MVMEKKEFIIRIEGNFGQLSTDTITKIMGNIKARDFEKIISHLDLEANPRASKICAVTDAIQDTISNSPHLFPFKSKGVLLATSNYTMLERNRIRISIDDPSIEGILDGGHNTLAIGLDILRAAYDYNDERIPCKVKTWNEFKSVWNNYKDKIAEYIEADSKMKKPHLDYMIPVEIHIPTESDDERCVRLFKDHLIEICESRNNNAELQLSAKVNQYGYFDDLKAVVKQKYPKIAARIEWKTNDGGAVKADRIVALSWIPLKLVDPVRESEDSEKIISPANLNVTNIYSSKGICMSQFEKLMSSPDVTVHSGDNYTKILSNNEVKSAFEVAADLPAIYDKLYVSFGDYYNRNGGKFGGITAVKAKNLNKKGDRIKTKKKPFSGESIDIDDNVTPEGFIMPLIYGFQAIMDRVEVNGEIKIQWSENPWNFIETNMERIVGRYKGMLETCDFDPQKVGKTEQCYITALDSFKMAKAGIL